MKVLAGGEAVLLLTTRMTSNAQFQLQNQGPSPIMVFIPNFFSAICFDDLTPDTNIL